MAQKKSGTSGTSSKNKNTASGSRSPRSKAAPAKSSRSPRVPAAAAQKPPRRREIAAWLCLFLGLLSFIGYFDTEPWFISFFTGFVKRLIGYGYYALPPALIMCFVILLFHKGYPVLLRTISTLSLTAIVGSLVHIFAVDKDKYEMSFSLLLKLWSDGALLEAGGLISGFITELFRLLFGNAGTIIALILLTGLFAMIAFNATFAGVLNAFRGRERREYEPQPEYDENLTDEENAANTELYRHRERKYRYPLIPLWKRKKIDIPLDDKKKIGKDYFSDAPGGELFNKKPNVKTPDEVLDSPPWDAAGQGELFGVDGSDDDPLMQEDLPFDIPFIDEKWHESRAPAPVVPPIISEKFETATGKFPVPEGAEKYFKAKNKASLEDTKEYGGLGMAAGWDAAAAASKPAAVSGQAAAASASAASAVSKSGKNMKSFVPEQPEGYCFPPIDLLSTGNAKSKAGDEEVRINSERLEKAFQSFNLNVKISRTTRGPAVTQYEAELEAGIKLSRLTSLADDIALSLGTSGVRIAPMPNKIATVGIEVPNIKVSTVALRDIIESTTFVKEKSRLTFAIGMNIPGESIVGDISKLPHLLIAGTTGSGKSVCLNSIILSLLYKSTPDEVKFIMIDPKMVEFKVYNGIPHLLVPVVTDVKKAAGALQWATFEMMKRYSLFAEKGARDLAGYNLSVKKSEDEKPLPQIVIIIDELADLMLMAAKDVEESVCRIAQMGRAAGMHLVIATQSPRADVITGLMKANIPSRISFRVASALESRIILDAGGNADKLVGNGDMLYAPTGVTKPMRVQGTWVSDDEREKVIDYIKKHAQPDYSDEVIHEIDKAAESKDSGGKSSGGGSGSGDSSAAGGDYDELLPQAVDIIFEAGQGQASVSMLQRRLKLGYARAARIVDQMEEMGIVGQFEGSKPRTLLITKAQWQQMQYAAGTAPVDTVVDVEEEVL